MKNMFKKKGTWLLLGHFMNGKLAIDSVMQLVIVNIITILGALHLFIVNTILIDAVAVYCAAVYITAFIILHTKNGVKYFNIIKVFIVFNVLYLYGFLYGNIWVFLIPTMVVLLMGLRIGVSVCLLYLTFMVGLEHLFKIHNWNPVTYYACIFLAQLILTCAYEVLRIDHNKKLQGDKEKIEFLSITDHLTKLYNRRYFETSIEKELVRAARQKESVSFLMIDVDKFKYYNDTYGHLQGDELLISISEIFKKVTKRTCDLVFRMGGEEFGILLPDTDLNGAFLMAEKIRLEVQNAGKATVSIGIASILPHTFDTYESLLRLADSNLYKAKERGRNMVVYQ